MANQEHLDILRQGVEVWNEWRREHGEITPDLSGVDLRCEDLDGADLSRADLSDANLSGAFLDGANLSDANLSSTLLSVANLDGANLSRADLSRALLSRAYLSQAKLGGAKLSGAFFIEAILGEANLGGANLSNANFAGADLSSTDLKGANLSATILSSANLSDADLSGADLSNARLAFANFNDAILRDANLANADIGSTVFAETDLSSVKGLESAKHDGPSTIGFDTAYKSEGNIPEVFLRGCGLKDWEIEAVKLYRPDLSPGRASEILYRVHELRTNPAIQFNSCFISYSSKNHEFADALYKQLQDTGVRCWFAPENLKIGDKFRQRIDEAIRLHDKLLLILSAESVVSNWVAAEVEAALEREDRENRLILFPLRIDDAIEQSTTAWAALLRRMRHIGDFSRWKDRDSYSQAFARLLRDLKA